MLLNYLEVVLFPLPSEAPLVCISTNLIGEAMCSLPLVSGYNRSW